MRRRFWYGSQAVQRAWEVAAASFPEDDPRAAEAWGQAWRSYWRRCDLWEMLLSLDGNFDGKD